MVDPLCCDDIGGTPQGAGTTCTFAEACCLPDGLCVMVDPLCCDDIGGTPQGLGAVCTMLEACCLPDGSCTMVDPLCCDDIGGTPQGLGTVCTPPVACCVEGAPDDMFLMTDQLCCDEVGGVLFSNLLLGDVNNDGKVDGDDIKPMTDALTGGPYNCRADMNASGSVDLADKNLFVARLLQ